MGRREHVQEYSNPPVTKWHFRAQVHLGILGSCRAAEGVATAIHGVYGVTAHRRVQDTPETRNQSEIGGHRQPRWNPNRYRHQRGPTTTWTETNKTQARAAQAKLHLGLQDPTRFSATGYLGEPVIESP